MRHLSIFLAAAAAGLLTAGPLHSGQVRVNVGPTLSFSPASVTVNPGDHVVWVWIGSGHTVTSGTDGSSDGDGRFVTTLLNVGDAFSWKSALPGPVPYYCEPHFLANMTGVIQFGTASVPDFRITEVIYNDANQLDLIEITNFGAQGNLGRYRFATSIDSATVPVNDFVVGVGGRVRVHVNVGGTQSAPTDLYLPTLLDLPDVSGSLGLYVPNTNPGTTSFGRPDQMIDFVQWGTSPNANEAVAVAAGFWTVGDFIPTMNFGHAIEFCGTSSDRGKIHWAEVAVPNIGTNGGCSTPTLTTTWGRIKALYR